MVFKLFDEHAKGLISGYTATDNYVGSDYAYYAFLDWFFDLEYAEENDALYLRATMDNGELYYWPPLVKGAQTRRNAARALPDDACFACCAEDFVDEMKDDYAVYANRDWSEYIYLSSEFIALPGKRYHAKRNHVSKFQTAYNSTMERLKASDMPELTAFESKWLETKTYDGELEQSAKDEMKIVQSWYAAALEGKLVCDVLRVDGEVAGVSIAEILPSKTAIVIYEKADVRFDGVYTYLANTFARRNLSECRYINRQEDMGIEGLRKSKLSYCPAYLLNKYVLRPVGSVPADGEVLLPHSMTNPALCCVPPDDSLSEYGFLPLSIEDYDTLMTFYEKGMEGLADKRFFMNYTEEELKEVLASGYVLGAFYEGRLVSVCAFDCDKEFGDKLSALCHDESGVQYYEFSGIMTDSEHRKRGLSNEVCRRVICYARENYAPCVLCATVQHDNEASLHNLGKLGFREAGRAQYKQYDFKYLTLNI